MKLKRTSGSRLKSERYMTNRPTPNPPKKMSHEPRIWPLVAYPNEFTTASTVLDAIAQPPPMRSTRPPKT